jgi:hypothetical protein
MRPRRIDRVGETVMATNPAAGNDRSYAQRDFGLHGIEISGLGRGPGKKIDSATSPGALDLNVATERAEGSRQTP